MATWTRQHQPRGLPNRWMSIGNGNWPADEVHRTKIIYVISQICGLIGRNAMRLQPIAHHRALVINAM